ncbi:MAG: H+-transporting two-sector ATPase, subunit [Sphingomonas bacterium]|nr:H+-transporting two-sector ATPase, subunit [Sphingomonas bacterium]
MPQISQLAATYASQFFWLAIIFGLIYFGIGRAMLPKIEATVDSRDRKIADDLAAAERARASADASEEAYRSRLGEVRAASLKATQEAKTASARDAEMRVKAADDVLAQRAAEAEARLRVQQAAALAGLEEVAAEAAQDIVARISGANVDRADASGAVKAVLARA